MEKIRNTTIAKRSSIGIRSPKASGKAHPRRRPARTSAREGKPRLATVLAAVVLCLLGANVFIFISGMPKEAFAASPRASAGSQETMLAAMPGYSPSDSKPAPSPSDAPAIAVPAVQGTSAYSTDIDDLSGYSLIVNKSRMLSPEYEPDDLESPNVPFAKGKMKVRREASKAFERMQQAASAQGVRFSFYSGYRAYAYQKQIWENSIKVSGQAWATKYIAPPGASEHQSGLAIDVSCAETGQQLEESFADSPSGAWLAKHCDEFGFILRYPKGSEAITGYSYEPWHFRYVGVPLARDLASSGLTLEEFFHIAR